MATHHRQKYSGGEDDAPEGDRQRIDARFVQSQGSVFAQHFGESAAGTPQQRGEDNAQTCLTERGKGHQTPLGRFFRLLIASSTSRASSTPRAMIRHSSWIISSVAAELRDRTPAACKIRAV